MPKFETYRLPDAGEGLTEAEIVDWKVAVGDILTFNQVVCEIETAKSLVDLPSPFEGLVTKVLVAAGDTAQVGEPILEVDVDPSGAPDESSGSDGSGGEAAADGGSGSGGTGEKREANLVGYGPRTGASTRRRRRGAPASGYAPLPSEDESVQVPMDRILAKPPVRKLAKDLGIALADVFATGPDGTVTREDVLAKHADADPGAGSADRDGPDPDARSAPGSGSPSGSTSGSASGAASGSTSGARDAAVGGSRKTEASSAELAASMPSPRNEPFSGLARDSRTTRVAIKSVRKRTAEAMVSSAFTAPHVTTFNTIDVTGMMHLVEKLRVDREWRDIHVSPLLIVAKALLVAIRRNPEVNASWDEAAQEIVYKHYVNLGIAAATPRGLIVPNIKDAHLMNLRELAVALSELTQTARAGKTKVENATDGTITITNVGVFGIDTGTPILNPGEAAILAFGAVKMQPWVHHGEVVPRQVTQLSLSFDHRFVDGALGSILLADVSRILEDPGLGLVWG